MANKPLDTTLLDRAIVFAVRAHAGTERRGKGFPYIVHPMEAVEIVATMTPDQELLAAAALHDTVDMRAIARDFAIQGDQLWNLFNVKDRQEHEWHYRGLADALSELRDTFAYKEFEDLINQVFKIPQFNDD